MKTIIYLCIACLSCITCVAQNTIRGSITDQNKHALAYAVVYLPEINKGTVTDQNGQYEITNLPNGQTKIQFSFLGYTQRIENIELKGRPVTLDVMLVQTTIEAEEIVVSGGYSSTQHDNAVKIDVLKLKPGENKNSPNFMETITRVPGVDMISKGSGVSKPVIRGLSMNDILVLNNGVRFENYQYSSHHPLGIDEFGIENVEVIKGPASLLYGSDAIGGVVNFIKEKPAAIGSMAGDYNLQLYSNSLGMTNNLGVKGASKKYFGGFRFGQKTNADYLQGGGAYTPNSRFNEYSAKANAGFTDKIGTLKLFYDYTQEKLGLVEEEAIEQITERGRENNIWYQELNTHLFSEQSKLYLGKYKLDVNSAYQNTELIHYGEANVFEIQMKLATLTYEAKLHLPAKKNSEYILGFQGFNQQNTNLNNRETKLLPDAMTNNYSGFVLLQHTFFKKLKLQTGVRYDNKSIATQAVGSVEDTLSYRPPLDKYFGSFSGSLGATYNLSEKLLFRGNFASAYRTPNLAELTSNGQHETRYEIGDHSLVPENSFETDFSIHYHKDNFAFDVAGFYNIVNNYIFISPTGDTTNSGIAVFRYKQTNSVLFGGEAGMHYHPKPIKWLHCETTFSTVRGVQQSGDYLPFVPADKLKFELKAEKEKLSLLHNAFIAFNSCTAFPQNNAAPDESTTPDYTLIDMSIGGELKAGSQMISISVSANNLLDKKYVDHLSTLKEVGLFNPGRNIAFSLKVPFYIKKTH